VSKSVVGLDIGSTSVRGAEVARPGTPKAALTRFAEVPLPEGAVSRGEVLQPEVVASALKNLWSAGKFSSKKVVLGMGNQRVLARDLTVPKMSLARIRESLPFHVQDMLPVPVADALLDFYPIGESQGDTGLVVHGLLVAAVKDAVDGNIAALRAAGLTPVEVDLIPFALSRLLITRPALPGAVALVDIGANTTSVVIAVDGVPNFVRIIPAGGEDVTQALAADLGVDVQRAEELKRRLGLETPDAEPGSEEQRAVAVIRAVAGELVTSLQKTLNYFVNTRTRSPLAQVIVTGGGANLGGLAEALGESARVSVTHADPAAAVAVAKTIAKSGATKDVGSRGRIAVALGLALGSSA